MGSSSSKPQTRFESLNDDTLTTTLEFVGNKSYRSFGGVNKHCKEIYLATKGMTKETFLYGYAPLSVIIDKIERGGIFNPELHKRVGKGVLFYNRRDILAWALQERKMYLLRAICNVAGKEGRIDILEEVWNNVIDSVYINIVFGEAIEYAARFGKLNVIKWFCTKGFVDNLILCSFAAAKHGHLDILQWLKEEQGLELHVDLYVDAIDGGNHLHVMKWLREQEVPWGKWTFGNAAKKGNLAILQWLHDEGCPWPDDEYYRVDEYEVEPEVLEWLRANGYSDRIVV